MTKPHWTLAAIVALFAAWLLIRCFTPNADRGGEGKPGVNNLEIAERGEYVGVASCADCHPDQAERFEVSGHAHTFELVAGTDKFDWLAGQSFRDADRDGLMQYALDDDGLWARMGARLPDREFPLQYALGSGHHAVTFLSLIPDDLGETVGVEHRVSIFGDLELRYTPGAASLPPSQEVEYFGKLIAGEQLDDCVSCHTTTSRIENTQVVDLRPNVQCERCHGPGGGHVAAVESGQNELRLNFIPGTTQAMQEIRMCGECHRLPQMLSDTPLERTEPKLTRYQPVGLLQSACFTGSDGELRCTTCHDPHEAAAARTTAEYEQICRSCHVRHSVSECVVATENCISCHMPPVEVHPHIAFHDHWIRVRDADDPASIETTD